MGREHQAQKMRLQDFEGNATWLYHFLARHRSQPREDFRYRKHGPNPAFERGTTSHRMSGGAESFHLTYRRTRPTPLPASEKDGPLRLDACWYLLVQHLFN
jgi:hypothetical protein